MSQITQAVEKREVEYLAFGTQEKIRLSIGMVRQYVAAPAYDRNTKAEIQISDREAMQFIMLCKARQLNVWEGDAFAVPFWDGRAGCHKWALITAHNAFLKRGEANQSFVGMESGVIIEVDGAVKEMEGDFVPDTLDGEKVKLVGGWAKVYRKDREKPMYKRLKLATFQKDFGNWVKDPAGMIVKCAEADALRSSFPNTMGGMYLREEMGVQGSVDIVSEPVAERRPDFAETKALTQTVSKVDKKQPKQGTDAPKTPQDAPKAPPAPPTQTQPETLQGEAAGENAPASEREPDPEGLNHSGRQGDMAETEASTGETTPEDTVETPEGEPEGEELPPFKPRPGESDALSSVRLMMHRNRIPELAMMSWARQQKLAKEGQALGDLSSAKIENINANFSVILPKIRAIMQPKPAQE